MHFPAPGPQNSNKGLHFPAPGPQNSNRGCIFQSQDFKNSNRGCILQPQNPKTAIRGCTFQPQSPIILAKYPTLCYFWGLYREVFHIMARWCSPVRSCRTSVKLYGSQGCGSSHARPISFSSKVFRKHTCETQGFRAQGFQVQGFQIQKASRVQIKTPTEEHASVGHRGPSRRRVSQV